VIPAKENKRIVLDKNKSNNHASFKTNSRYLSRFMFCEQEIECNVKGASCNFNHLGFQELKANYQTHSPLKFKPLFGSTISIPAAKSRRKQLPFAAEK